MNNMKLFYQSIDWAAPCKWKWSKNFIFSFALKSTYFYMLTLKVWTCSLVAKVSYIPHWHAYIWIPGSGLWSQLSVSAHPERHQCYSNDWKTRFVFLFPGSGFSSALTIVSSGWWTRSELSHARALSLSLSLYFLAPQVKT